MPVAPSPARPSLARRAAGWGVHAFTASGLPLSLWAALALFEGDAPTFFLAIWLTAMVDSVDGAMARAVRIKEAVPEVDGSMLDNLIDFLTFSFLPALALPALGLLPEGAAWWAALPLVASGYQFSQTLAKTDQSFVGFPSYWNVLVLYLYVLDATPAWTIGSLVALSILSFVPLHYLYPSRTRFLRPVTLSLGALWGAAMIAMCLAPHASWAPTVGWISLLFPAYYLGASVVNDRRIRRTA